MRAVWNGPAPASRPSTSPRSSTAPWSAARSASWRSCGAGCRSWPRSLLRRRSSVCSAPWAASSRPSRSCPIRPRAAGASALCRPASPKRSSPPPSVWVSRSSRSGSITTSRRGSTTSPSISTRRRRSWWTPSCAGARCYRGPHAQTPPAPDQGPPQGPGAGRDQRDPAGRRGPGAAHHLHGDNADDRPRRQRRAADHQPPRRQERRQQGSGGLDQCQRRRLRECREGARRPAGGGGSRRAAALSRQGNLPQGRSPDSLRHRAGDDGGYPPRRCGGRPARYRRGKAGGAGALMAFSVGGGRRGPQGEINVTPLIDIVLVLLIIFMVMTPVMLKEIVAKVPQKQTENVPLPPGETTIVVELDAHDQLSLNGEAVAPEMLGVKVGDRLVHDRQKVVFL